MPRLAATVMLARPLPSGFEVLMLRRAETSHFVPDAYVFPGGTVESSDSSPEMLARMRGTEQAVAQFRSTESALLPAGVSELSNDQAAALLAAAVRELFEETGILLGADGRELRAFDQLRAQLHAGNIAFPTLLERNDLYADAERLVLFSQWITPASLPKRYNAHFFLACANSDQIATADSIETRDAIWISPRKALERSTAGELQVVYPTRKHLERLAEFDDLDKLLAFARIKPIVRIMPEATADGFAIPSELEFAW